MRCAECNCENGDEDCNWIVTPPVGLLPLLSDEQKKRALNVTENETTGDPKFMIPKEETQ